MRILIKVSKGPRIGGFFDGIVFGEALSRGDRNKSRRS
mgnify:CR=1 FL=1